MDQVTTPNAQQAPIADDIKIPNAPQSPEVGGGNELLDVNFILRETVAIQPGQIVADFFKLLNMNFYETKFEQFYTNNKYSTVLSCANHSTYDGETEYSLDEYFSKISNLLIERGSLLFESHHPLIEKDISDVKNCISKYFDIKEEIIVEGGNFIDNGRTWLLCKKLIVK